MADISILISAREVDEIAQQGFRERSRRTQIPKAESSRYDAQKLHLFYGLNNVDGRVVTARFLNHLAENGYDSQIAKPPAFDDPAFDVVAFAQILQSVVNQVAVSSDRKLGTCDLLSYSRGDLQIVDKAGKPRFYVTGAKPRSTSVSIRAAMGAEDQSTLYRDFVRSLA